MQISVIIATRNRPGPLELTLQTVNRQTLRPLEVIVVDSSEGPESRCLVEALQPGFAAPIRYIHSTLPSAAGQRNIGMDDAQGAIGVFMDDDVELEPEFLQEVSAPIRNDSTGRVAGVSGTIINQTYSQPSGLNWLALALCLGDFRASWAGKVVGPAVNFLPDGQTVSVQRVEWLFTGGTAYRRDVFLRYRFDSFFQGYSFAEDVHLSARIGREWILLNTPKARFYHHDMGGSTHKDWRLLGESMVVNRHAIMADVLERRGIGFELRLLLYELGYGSLAWLAGGDWKPDRLRRLAQLMSGKIRGFRRVWGAIRPTASHA